MNQTNLNGFTKEGIAFLNANLNTQNIIVFSLLFLLLVLTIVFYLKLSKYRFTLLSIRLSIIIAVFFIYIEPSFEYIKKDYNKNKIITLIDTSESMSLPVKSNNNRLSNIKYFFDSNKDFFKQISEKYNAFYYKFANESNLINFSKIKDLVVFGNQTSLIKSLDKIIEEQNIAQISSVIIASDFVDTEEELKADNNILAKILQKNIPINIVVPQKTVFKDISIKNLRYDSYSFVQNTTTVDVEVQISGYKNINTKLAFYEENKLIEEKSIYLTEENNSVKINFKFKPQKVGSYVYKIKIPVLEDEALFENNEKQFIIKTIRDKIRVVQVVGRPSWDVRFLRQMLKNHPDVDLVSFFILRTMNDVDLVDQNELSLIPFPTHELFQNKLNTFDLVIFQNFDYRPYHIAPYLDNIKNFVEKRGGGFVMIGGDSSFSNGNYAETSIKDILPVEMPSDSSNKSIYLKSTNMEVTENGFESPFFKFNVHPDIRKEITKQLPKIEGFNITTLKKNATLLAESEKTENGKKYPLIAITQAGKGRTMAITTDSLWTWNFHKLSTIAHKQLYTYFWDKAIKWLIQDPDLNLIKISADKTTIKPKENYSAVIKCYNFQYEPLKAGKLIYSITNIDTNEKISQKDVLLNEEGFITISENISNSGSYRIDLTSYENNNIVDKVYEVFLVQYNSQEFDNPSINSDFLDKISKNNNVTVLKYTDNTSNLKIKNQEITVSERIYKPIWDNVYLLFALILLFLFEIYIKRYRM